MGQEEFGLHGMDVRLSIKSTSDSNPFAAKASTRDAAVTARRRARGRQEDEDEENARHRREEREAARALAAHRRDEVRGGRAYKTRTVGLMHGGRRPVYPKTPSKASR